LTISTYLADVWSATEFGDPELSGYAETQLRKDTRVGVQMMALLSLIMQVIVAVFVVSKGLGGTYLYTNVVLGVFSLHIVVSAAYVDEAGQLADPDALYKRADRALYSAKQHRPRAAVEQPVLTRTGQWKI